MNLINKFFFFKDKRRKKILINPSFQLEIISRVVYFFVFLIGGFYGISYYFFHQLMEKGRQAGLPLDSDYFIFINNSSKQFDVLFLLTTFVSLVLIYYFGLILSHRIAGPIHKIDITIDQIIKNRRREKISLRDQDYFHDHADKINELINMNDTVPRLPSEKMKR